MLEASSALEQLLCGAAHSTPHAQASLLGLPALWPGTYGCARHRACAYHMPSACTTVWGVCTIVSVHALCVCTATAHSLDHPLVDVEIDARHLAIAVASMQLMHACFQRRIRANVLTCSHALEYQRPNN
jgi:hypothetical protein